MCFKKVVARAEIPHTPGNFGECLYASQMGLKIKSTHGFIFAI